MLQGIDLRTANDTASKEFAPNKDLFSVPSRSIIDSSINLWSYASIPIIIEEISLFILFTAFCTPLPEYLSLLIPSDWLVLNLPSLNSIASFDPVLAPDGTDE